MRYPGCSREEELSLLSRAGGANKHRGTNAELALKDGHQAYWGVEVLGSGTPFYKGTKKPGMLPKMSHSLYGRRIQYTG